MSDQTFTLSAAGIEQLHLSTSSGDVTLYAEERDDVLVESGAAPPEKKAPASVEEKPKKGFLGWASHDHHHHGPKFDESNSIHLHSSRRGSADLVMRCPSGFNIVVGSASGAVHLKGSFGEVKATTASGSIEIEKAETVDLRTVAGNITVESCSGVCRISAVSGKSSVGSCHSMEASSVSGKIELRDTIGAIKVRTVSGKVEVATQGKGGVMVQTVSGGVTVAVPEGCHPATRLSSLASRPHSDCPEGNDFEIKVKSMSGNIDVVAR